MMEYIIVNYPEDRDVYADGIVIGRTNEMFKLEPGTYSFSLGSPIDYEPEVINIQVLNTTPLDPSALNFNPLKRRPKKKWFST